MKKTLFAIPILSALQLLAYGQIFNPTCPSPLFPSPAPKSALAIDSDCGAAGSGGAEANQNKEKNNFCPTTSAPSAITIADLQKLQNNVQSNPGINFGDEAQPPRKKGPTVDRSPLKHLGEGKQVVFRGFVLIARQEGAESVNCGKSVPNQPLLHDIHISLVESSSATLDDECSSIVAEMIPHHRPDSWTQENVMAVADAHLPVRVTGQLFFDSSHVTCQGGQKVRSNPKRTSLWELHPIYKFEVCANGSCDSEASWTSLSDWVARTKPVTRTVQ